MSMQDMMKQMLGPMLEPIIREFKPQFESLAREFVAVSKRTANIENQNIEILNNQKRIENKLDEVLKNGGRDTGSGADASGGGDGNTTH